MIASEQMKKLGVIPQTGKPGSTVVGRDNNGGFNAPSFLQIRPEGQATTAAPAEAPTDNISGGVRAAQGGMAMQQPVAAPKAPPSSPAISQNPTEVSPQNALLAGQGTPIPPPATMGQTPQPTGGANLNAQPMGGQLAPASLPQIERIPQGAQPGNVPMINAQAPVAPPVAAPAAPVQAAAAPAAPAPLTPQQPGALPQMPVAPGAPVKLQDLGGEIEKNLGNPSAFNSDLLQQTFGYLKGDLENTRDKELANADIDAASRGMYFGTPGLQSRSNVREKYNRGVGDLATQLALKQAETYGNDRQQAMDAAFKFVGGANEADAQEAQLAALMASLGMNGAPTMAGAAGMNIPTPDFGGIDPAAIQALGAMFAGNNPGATATEQRAGPVKKKPEAQTPTLSWDDLFGNVG